MSKNDLLNSIFKKYDLYFDPSNPESKDNDVFVHKHYKIITRAGIQKIEARAGIRCKIAIAASGETYCNVTGTGTTADGQEYTTLASANAESSKNPYYAEMAEKRCRSRIILTLVGLYEQGVLGEDEADEFRDVVKTARFKS
jgi:hypothetical protein